MAWTEVETPNARYILLFSSHSQITEESQKEFDAVVLESGGLSPKKVSSFLQYQKIIKQAIKNKKQIWLTDAGTSTHSNIRMGGGVALLGALSLFGIHLSKKAFVGIKSKRISRREFLKKIGLSVGLLSPLGIFITNRINASISHEVKNPKYWERTYLLEELIAGKGTISIRNAITAEKCESFVAPNLQRELGRKPVIAMVWGGAHYNIKGLLENPQKRQRILRESRLEKYVKEPSKSYRILLDEKGQIREVKEFPETLRIPRKPERKIKRLPDVMGRRQFLAKLAGRGRRA